MDLTTLILACVLAHAESLTIGSGVAAMYALSLAACLHAKGLHR